VEKEEDAALEEEEREKERKVQVKLQGSAFFS